MNPILTVLAFLARLFTHGEQPMPKSGTPRTWHRFVLAVSACAGMLAVPSIPVIPIVGGSLLFSGLSEQAIAGQIYYVDGTSGNDSNAGTTAGTSFKTTNALPTLASGDTVYLAGSLRNNTAPFTGAATNGPGLLQTSGLSNVTIAAMPAGSSPPEFRGDQQLVQTGWSASTNAWQLTLTGATASAPDAVVYKWDANVDGSGHHYGHLVPDTLANVQNATGSIGRYNYNTITNVMTVYLGGDNPNSSGFPVGVCWVPTSQEAVVKFSGGSNNTISGISFALYPSQGATGQTGWAVIAMSSPNATIFGCTCKDMGAHGFGSYASGSSSSGCYIVGCTTQSGRAGGGGAYIHFTTSAFTLTARNANCRADEYVLLGTDGLPVASGSGSISAVSVANPTHITAAGHGLKTGDVVAITGTSTTGSTVGTFDVTVLDANNFTIPVNVSSVTTGTGTWTATADAFSGNGFYAHSDSGTPVQDILNTGCIVQYYQNPGFAFQAFNAGFTPAVADGTSWASYPCRCDQCQIINSNQEYYTAGVTAFRRSKIKQTYQLPEGGGGTRGAITLWTGAGDGTLLFETCEFIFDFSDTAAGGNVTRGFSCNSNSGNSYIRLVNPSGHDVSTQTASNFHAFFDYVSVDAKLFRVYGGAFSFNTVGGATALCIADGGTSLANHAFIDSAYWHIGTNRYSQNASIQSQTLWSLNIDDSGTFAASAMFTVAPTNLSLSTTSSLYTVRRLTTAVVPTLCINGPYRTFKGAYQPIPAMGTLIAQNSTLQSGGPFRRLGHWWRRNLQRGAA